ncbi:enoyl-CoA hydratase [Achromobacter veterisilvae]|jgi:enoyl-CoA hydratase|uniref:Enoyl-CoA hydratase n=1 Tax=Achromobacter veterisilvae TaxID=2069367 RepID=A0A446CH69_9BURK|nr:enoyl-CoA hydratase [Achromobacter veterisilvae]SSW67210.1 Short-chain-enoyl-CoA hydratase [Achromobacter veterisilvae]
MSTRSFTVPHARAEIEASGIATLTMQDAGVLNILSTPVIDGLREALAQLRDDDAVRVLVLRGASDRAFVAGADIAEMAALDEQKARTFISNLRDLCNAVRHFPVPVIARIPGWCLGGGLEFALACDLRISADDAQFGMPEVKVGIPSVIHAALMPPLIGAANSAWMLLTGDLIDARRARDWGLVNAAVPRADLDAAVRKLAEGFAALGPAALRQQKKLLRRWETMSVDQAIEDSVAEFGAAFNTGEPQKFMNEFLESKRRR